MSQFEQCYTAPICPTSFGLRLSLLLPIPGIGSPTLQSAKMSYLPTKCGSARNQIFTPFDHLDVSSMLMYPKNVNPNCKRCYTGRIGVVLLDIFQVQSGSSGILKENVLMSLIMCVSWRQSSLLRRNMITLR